MSKAGVTHDLTISTVSGTALGFMLWRGKGSRRGYGIADSPTVQPIVPSIGEATEASFPSNIAMYFSQTDWRGGIGGDTSQTDPLRLADGVKIDSSIYGKIQNAREVKATTVAATAPDAYKATGFALVGTEVHGFVGQDVYQWNYTTKNWDILNEPVNAANIYRNGVEFAGDTFVPSWLAADDTPARYIHKADADAQWTRIGAGTGTQTIGFKYCAAGKNADGDNLFWAAYILRADATYGKNIIVSTTDPTTIASWSSEVAIGDSAAEITGLLIDGDTVIVLKTDGIWAYYGDTGQENLTPDFEGMAHPDNFRGAINWNGHILLPGGVSGLYELTGGSLFSIGPDIFAPNLTTLQGRVVAMAGEPTALFIMVQDTANLKMHILMAKWVELNGGINYRWHHVGSIAYTTGATPSHSAMLAEGVPSGSTIHHRIWLGVESTGSNLLPYFYPLATDDEDGFTNDTDAVATFDKYDAGRSQVQKTFASVDLEVANLGAGGRQYLVDYRLDAGTWSTEGGGPAKLADSSGNADGVVDTTTSSQTLTFPSGTTGKVLELRAYPALTTVGTTSPEIRGIRVTCTLRAPATKILPLSLHLGDGVRNLNGSVGGRPKLDLAQLETWDAQAAEVTVVDPRGTSRDMVFVSGKLKVTEVNNEARRRPEYKVDITLATV